MFTLFLILYFTAIAVLMLANVSMFNGSNGTVYRDAPGKKPRKAKGMIRMPDTARRLARAAAPMNKTDVAGWLMSPTRLLFAVVAHLRNAFRFSGLPAMANQYPNTTSENGVITRFTDAALAQRHLLVKAGSDANHIAINGAADRPLGPVDDDADGSGRAVAVALLGASVGTRLMIASEAIAVGDAVYTAANGKVQDEPAGASVHLVGWALSAAAADGDPIEVMPCSPVAVTFA